MVLGLNRKAAKEMLKNIQYEYTQSRLKFIDAIPEVVIVLKYLAHSVCCNTRYLQQCTVSYLFVTT